MANWLGVALGASDSTGACGLGASAGLLGLEHFWPWGYTVRPSVRAGAGTPVPPRAGSGGWSSWTILKLKAEERNAGRLDPRPNRL